MDAKIYEIYFKANQLRSSDSVKSDGDSAAVSSDCDRDRGKSKSEEKKIILEILKTEYGIQF